MAAILSDLDIPLNKLPKAKHERLKDETDLKKAFLSRITHVMDYEYFTLDIYVVYSKISVLDILRRDVLTLQLYDPLLLDYKTLTSYQRKTVDYQYRSHRLRYVNKKESDELCSVEEGMHILLDTLPPGSGVGYKGGDFERRLCRQLNVKCVKLELLGCPIYESLCEAYEVTPLKCGHHRLRFVGESGGKKSVTHCSPFEVILFSLYILSALTPFFDAVTFLNLHYFNG